MFFAKIDFLKNIVIYFLNPQKSAPLCSTVPGWCCCDHTAMRRTGAPSDNNPQFAFVHKDLTKIP